MYFHTKAVDNTLYLLTSHIEGGIKVLQLWLRLLSYHHFILKLSALIMKSTWWRKKGNNAYLLYYWSTYGHTVAQQL